MSELAVGDYALVGDTPTAALSSSTGSIDYSGEQTAGRRV